MLTTCQASVSRLPIELLGLIIEYVENISAVSLVSRLFRRAALPLAYHTLKFSRIKRIDGFIDLVHTEGNEYPSQIGRFLRRLIFHHALNLGHSLKPFDDNLVSRLRVIMPKLVNLEHITWNAWGYATFTRLFADLQPWCPKLRSLDMDAGRKGDDVPSEATDMQAITCSPPLIYLSY
ncbi:hypothetical protein FS749_011334 [Ceratobasidium sp. UAMH 11750]|nr:hypothetical protein FS749_011334 [Ceratobasidium sp. UAMH 11750]